MGFRIKKIAAFLLNFFGILNLLLVSERKKYHRQYIRIINYHNVAKNFKGNFEQQIMWLKQHYQNIDFETFKGFLEEKENIDHGPGIMLTFDDGLSGNYKYARDILNKFKMTGYFMVSSDLVGTEGYMTVSQLKELLAEGHVIGCHTSTHHRMSKNDSQSVLEYEIIHAKEKLEKMLDIPISIFCWCGGEEYTYTRQAQKNILKAGYQYGFMTNSFPVTQTTDRFHIQRINVEDSWPIALLKFQISGIMDFRFRKKRHRVDQLTQIS